MYLYVVQQVIEGIYKAIPFGGVAHNYLSWLQVFDIIWGLFKCIEKSSQSVSQYARWVFAISVISQASCTEMHGKSSLIINNIWQFQVHFIYLFI